MFEIDHGNMPKGDEYRELRQFVNSMQLRYEAESLGCHSITVVASDYRDSQTGTQKRGYFVAPKDNPAELLLLLTEKEEGKGDGIFNYEAVPSYVSRGRWGDKIQVWAFVH